MKCRECGAILLDTDTFCGKCGAKVKINVCPECGETLRPGMRFCSNCGYEVIGAEEIAAEKEIEDVPVTGGLATTDIPFDLIEQSIIRDVERQLDVPEKIDSMREYTPKHQDQSGNQEKSGRQDISVHEIGETDYKKASDNSYADYSDNEYSDDDYYEDDESEENEEYDENEYNDDEYADEDYTDEEYISDEYDDYDENGSYVEEEDDFYEEEPASLGSRLLTAAMIVIGLILLIIIASFFFRNRNNKKTPDEDIQIEENIENNQDEEENTGNNTIGSIVVIENVNIRTKPDTNDSEILGVARKDEIYDYYGYADGNDNWIHIKVDDTTDGYVYKSYVSIRE